MNLTESLEIENELTIFLPKYTLNSLVFVNSFTECPKWRDKIINIHFRIRHQIPSRPQKSKSQWSRPQGKTYKFWAVQVLYFQWIQWQLAKDLRAILNLHINLYKILNYEHAWTSLALICMINGNVLSACISYESSKIEEVCPQTTIIQKWYLWAFIDFVLK